MAREIKDLHPKLQEIIPKFIAECEKQGLKVKIGECLRSKAEQDALYAQGRTTKGNIVTNVRYPNSFHCWGLAFDVIRNDGKGAYNTEGNWFYKVGQIGKKYGLTWGGDFKSIVDMPHFQLDSYGATASKLLSMHKNPDFFRSTWNAKVSNPYKEPTKKLVMGDRGEDVKYCQWVLNKLGYDTNGIDGIYGSVTRTAVGKYQTDKKWNPSYNIGKTTREALIKANKKLCK